MDTTSKRPRILHHVAHVEQGGYMTVKLISGLGVIGGLWLFVSPWILGFTTSDPTLAGNAIVGGIAIAIMMAVSYFSEVGSRRVSWVLVLGGIWLIVAALVYAPGTTSAFWNTVALGAITAIFGAFFMARAVKERTADRRATI
jgi:hypothetical protein